MCFWFRDYGSADAKLFTFQERSLWYVWRACPEVSLLELYKYLEVVCYFNRINKSSGDFYWYIVGIPQNIFELTWCSPFIEPSAVLSYLAHHHFRQVLPPIQLWWDPLRWTECLTVVRHHFSLYFTFFVCLTLELAYRYQFLELYTIRVLGEKEVSQTAIRKL